MHQLFVIYKKDKCWRSHSYLRHVIASEAFSLIHRRLLQGNRLGKNLIQDACRDTAVRTLDHLIDHRIKLIEPLACLRREKKDVRILHKGKRGTDSGGKL